MISSTINRKADSITALAVLTDEPILDTLNLGVHGNLNVYLYLAPDRSVTQVELDMDKYHPFGVAEDVLDALHECDAQFDPSTLTGEDITHLIARMRIRAS